jgi:hypothetical protein
VHSTCSTKCWKWQNVYGSHVEGWYNKVACNEHLNFILLYVCYSTNNGLPSPVSNESIYVVFLQCFLSLLKCVIMLHNQNCCQTIGKLSYLFYFTLLFFWQEVTHQTYYFLLCIQQTIIVMPTIPVLQFELYFIYPLNINFWTCTAQNCLDSAAHVLQNWSGSNCRSNARGIP